MQPELAFSNHHFIDIFHTAVQSFYLQFWIALWHSIEQPRGRVSFYNRRTQTVTQGSHKGWGPAIHVAVFWLWSLEFIHWDPNAQGDGVQRGGFAEVLRSWGCLKKRPQKEHSSLFPLCEDTVTSLQPCIPEEDPHPTHLLPALGLPSSRAVRKIDVCYL